MSLETILFYGVAFYVIAGFCAAASFVTFGVTKVQPMGVSFGARILLLPGAAALWPYVLLRWLKSERAP